MADTAMIEPKEKLLRRSQRRSQFTASALVFEPKSEAILRARTGDLGPEGCFIDTLNPFASGTVVKVRINKSSMSFEAWAKVVYSLDSMGMGLAFKPVGPEQLWVLQEWLGDSCGDLLPNISIPQVEKEFSARGSRKDIHCEALSELITELIGHGLIPEEKGNAILQKLSRCPQAQ
jgi:hypothetical protein